MLKLTFTHKDENFLVVIVVSDDPQDKSKREIIYALDKQGWTIQKEE